MYSGIFLAKINYNVDLRLIGGAVDVKIIQVAEPPVTKTLTFIDAIIMKAHTDKLVRSSPYTWGMPSTRATGAARSRRRQRCKDYASNTIGRGSRTIPQAVHEERDARRKLK